MCHMSHVMCHMSGDLRQVSCVMCHVFFVCFLDKVVELIELLFINITKYCGPLQRLLRLLKRASTFG